MLFSLVTFFVWGTVFHLFDSKIAFQAKPALYIGFFSWPLLGIFGLSFGLTGTKSGTKLVGYTLGLVGSALVLGILLGNYR